MDLFFILILYIQIMLKFLKKNKIISIIIILFFIFGPWGVYPSLCLTRRCVAGNIGGTTSNSCAWYLTGCPGTYQCWTNANCKKN